METYSRPFHLFITDQLIRRATVGLCRGAYSLAIARWLIEIGSLLVVLVKEMVGIADFAFRIAEFEPCKFANSQFAIRIVSTVAFWMLRKHDYNRQAFLPSEAQLLYCAMSTQRSIRGPFSGC
jgi:hypothetical protein